MTFDFTLNSNENQDTFTLDSKRAVLNTLRSVSNQTEIEFFLEGISTRKL